MYRQQINCNHQQYNQRKDDDQVNIHIQSILLRIEKDKRQDNSICLKAKIVFFSSHNGYRCLLFFLIL
jgi:hypothetical protein